MKSKNSAMCAVFAAFLILGAAFVVMLPESDAANGYYYKDGAVGTHGPGAGELDYSVSGDVLTIYSGEIESLDIYSDVTIVMQGYLDTGGIYAEQCNVVLCGSGTIFCFAGSFIAVNLVMQDSVTIILYDDDEEVYLVTETLCDLNVVGYESGSDQLVKAESVPVEGIMWASAYLYMINDQMPVYLYVSPAKVADDDDNWYYNQYLDRNGTIYDTSSSSDDDTTIIAAVAAAVAALAVICIAAIAIRKN